MRKILQQSSWLFLAQGLGRVIGFFYTIFLARTLGVEDFGIYAVALAYYSLFAGLADFGFSRFLIRELARGAVRPAQVFSHVAILRLTITSLLFAVFSIILYILDPDKLRVHISLLAVLTVLPASITQTLDGILIAKQKIKISAVSLVSLNLFTAGAGLFLIMSGFGVNGAVAALILGQLIYLITLLFFLRKQRISLLSVVKGVHLKQVLTGSLPYGLLAILGLIYFRIDTLMLSYMRGNFETGIYGAAYKFLEAIIFIPGAFSVVLFPTLAKLHDGNIEEMKKIYFKSMKLMVVSGIMLLIAYFFILPEVIRFFLPQYLEATDAIKILSFSIPFIFMATPGVQVMLSSNKYLKEVIYFSSLTVVFNIVFNLIFIPKFGFRAAAWITVVSDIMSFMLFYLLINRKIFAIKK
ncbi:flippase [Candidatus Daviesbacteria bacterium]|nr:flippase [Candidatus Daviesbacteria bacterium]